MGKGNLHSSVIVLAASGLLLAILAGSAFQQGRRGIAYAIGGAIVVLIIWFRERSAVSAWSLLPAAFLVAFYIARTHFLVGHAPFRESNTFDLYALYVDGSFGFQPSVWVHQIIAKSALAEALLQGVYEGLPVAIAVAYASNLASRRRWRIFVMMVLLALIGVQCYKLFPVCGPAYLPFGNDCFYFHGSCSTAPFFEGKPYMIGISTEWARNGMPSLHMSWALLAWWSCMNRPILRWIMFAFAMLTAIATLAFGEHYLIDLAAACPFSVMIWYLCMSRKPVSDPARIVPILAGGLGFVAWAWSLRFAPNVFYFSRAVPWLALLLSLTYIATVLWPERVPQTCETGPEST